MELVVVNFFIFALEACLGIVTVIWNALQIVAKRPLQEQGLGGRNSDMYADREDGVRSESYPIAVLNLRVRVTVYARARVCVRACVCVIPSGTDCVCSTFSRRTALSFYIWLVCQIASI